MTFRNGAILLILVAAVVGGALFLGAPESGSTGEVHVVRQAGGDTLTAEGVPDEVSEFMRNGQSWRAARMMRQHLASNRDAPPEAVLLAARAEAGWGGWERVREYLEGKTWLDEVRQGEAWFWLARSLEAEESWESALKAYDSYLRIAPEGQPGDRRRVAELRQALIMLRLGRTADGAALLGRAREHAAEIGPRLNILAAEAVAERGDTATVRGLTEGVGSDDLVRRSRLALLDAYQEAGDRAGAIALARGYGDSAGSAGGKALYRVRAARIALEGNDRATARALLLQVVREAPSATVAGEAAGLLADFNDLTNDERLATARVLDTHGTNQRAAALYASWLAAGSGTAEQRRQVTLSRGRALFDAGQFATAVTTLSSLTALPGEIGAEAMLLTGRAEARRGNAARSRQTFLSLAERHPRTEEGSEGLFLVADLTHDAGTTSTARSLYRRVASEFPGTDRAGLSLMRLAGMSMIARDYAGAARVWDEYRTSYPAGDRFLEATYWAGRARKLAGDDEQAAALYRTVRERDPLSYYALRAADGLGESYWPVPMGAEPPVDAAARARVEDWLHGVDLLREAGLFREAEAEADAVIARAGEDETVLYPLAEALNTRGYTSRGINMGYRLRERATQPNARLLKLVYPFPYRPMIEAEAREKGLDPFLVAALVRQESSFEARIASPVGARGLMQVMPETGRSLAGGLGISGWDAELLYQPEINTHLGTRFLADQMRVFRGSLPSVFAAYNAGPARIARWDDFPEYADPELFTERIPFRETRDYVKILTRNIAIYRGLYQP